MTVFWGAKKYDIAVPLLRVQGGRCAYCRRRLRVCDATLDHVMPLAVGGADEERNLLVVCEPCNVEKGNSLPTLEFHEAIRRRVHSLLEETAKTEVNC